MHALFALVLAATSPVSPTACAMAPPSCRGLADANGQTGRDGAAARAAATPRPVRVDVVVADSRGRVLDTLKSGDFTVREDGIGQTLDEVQFVKANGAGETASSTGTAFDERTEAAYPGARLFAIFLDEYHVGAERSARVRDALVRFVDETLGPRDLVVVKRPLDSLLTIRMMPGRDEVRRLISQFEGRKQDYTPRNDYERDYIAGTPSRVEQIRDQVTTSALNALALHLGGLNHSARKTLVVVSEGMARVDHRRGLEALPTVDSVIRAANRSNVSVYAIDPREAAVEHASTGDGDVLGGVAAATGGRSIAAAGDLAAAMRPIAADSSAYYLLTYRSSQAPDGRFHDVQVAVKRAGAVVRTRKGYWAAPPDEELRASLLRPAAPSVLGPPRRTSPLIQPWFGDSRGADGQTRVTFVWEPAVRVPGDRTRQARASRVVLKALGRDGQPIFEGSVRPTGASRLDHGGEDRVRAVFDVPPGPLRLQMSIEDETSQPIDSDVREISVRDLSGPVSLGTPEIVRARTARDFRALENDPDAAPVVSREFSRTERLMIRVPAYGPSGLPLTVTARLLSRSGQAMRELDLRNGAVSPSVSQLDLPLAGLASGEYLIEFSAKSTAGEVKDRVQFRVTN